MNSIRFSITIAALGAALSACNSPSDSSATRTMTKSVRFETGANACPGAIGEKSDLPSSFVSHGQVMTQHGELLHYTTTSGYLPLYDHTQTNQVRACMFFFAYTRDDQAANSKWPVTFLFNGGPGSPSDWLHLGGLGPKTMDFGSEGIAPKSSELMDDPFTLLMSTDLVFIDPINTGYSRPAQGVAATDFDGLHQDAESIGDFIHGFLGAYSRAASPKFIIGESYGGMRLPVLSRYLDEKLSVKLDGIVFVSPWLDAIGDTVFGPSDAADDLPYVNYLPEYATIAWYHHKLSADLEAKDVDEVFKEAETFASTDYLDALAAGDEITAVQRAAAVAGVARFSGIDPAFIDSRDLRFSLDDFRNGILKDTKEVVAYYDGRMKAVVSDPVNDDPYDAFMPLFTDATKTYFSGALAIETSLDYISNNWTNWPGANPDGGIQGGYLSVLDDINALMTKNPQLKVYVASGLFDLVCPAAEVHFMIRHLDPKVAPRIQIGHYPGGHPLYFGDIAHQKFTAEMASFLAPQNN